MDDDNSAATSNESIDSSDARKASKLENRHKKFKYNKNKKLTHEISDITAEAAHRPDKRIKILQERTNFPNEQEYIREAPKKSFMSSGQKVISKTSAVEASTNRSFSVSNAISIPSTSFIDTNSSALRTHSQPVTPDKVVKDPVIAAIKNMTYQFELMTKEFRELKNVIQTSALAQDAFGVNVQGFTTEYDISLPMKDKSVFKAFDDRLENEKKFRKEFTSTLHYLIDTRTTLSKNITAVLKKHLTRELAANFTAVKASGTKSVFKDTAFCKCLIEVARIKCKLVDQDRTIPMTDKLFYRELGNSLSNSVDWVGQRKLRPKPKADDPIPTVNDQRKEQVEDGANHIDNSHDNTHQHTADPILLYMEM